MPLNTCQLRKWSNRAKKDAYISPQTVPSAECDNAHFPTAAAAADARADAAGEQAFDPVKWFSGPYLRGHQTRGKYFWLGPDTVQKLVDNNNSNVDRATNLTADDLDQLGVPLSKCAALLFELSTLGLQFSSRE